MDGFDFAAEAERELEGFFFGVEPQTQAHPLALGGFFFQAPAAVSHPAHHRGSRQKRRVVAR